ncbi:MAG: hypothetical protein FWE09_00275 [Treponema sp.]|nr:hypothetical protein [Treponema sp.]
MRKIIDKISARLGKARAPERARTETWILTVLDARAGETGGLPAEATREQLERRVYGAIDYLSRCGCAVEGFTKHALIQFLVGNTAHEWQRKESGRRGQ